MSCMKIHYIFVSGGVISGIGKGITAASIGTLFKSAGLKVGVFKVDTYLNVDAGTMNPLEHGEVFVTQDGLETDQDLGHYERFMGDKMTTQNYCTAGALYSTVISNERALKYNGKCVQPYYAIPEELTQRLKVLEDGNDIALIELGGTVGEYEGMILFEAARRLKILYPDNVHFFHLVYLIVPNSLGEMKTKPAQMSIVELNKLGIMPDAIICRGPESPDKIRMAKLAMSAAIHPDYIFSLPDTYPVYRVPLILQEQNFTNLIFRKFKIRHKKTYLGGWKQMIAKVDKVDDHSNIVPGAKTLNITIAGKYYSSGNFCLEDSYVSVIESIKIAGWHAGNKVNIVWLDTETADNGALSPETCKQLDRSHAVIVPGGFGSRGVEGKIKVIEYVRKHKIPFLGLCYGMQLAVAEYARNVLKFRDAHTTEVSPNTSHPVIHLMPEQEKKMLDQNYGGSMRLGEWQCSLKAGTHSRRLYKSNTVYERHRHRYEFNNKYREKLTKAGMVIAGTTPDNKLVEIIELPKKVHPFFVGSQFHPEFSSNFLNPHPLFMGLIRAAQARLK